MSAMNSIYFSSKHHIDSVSVSGEEFEVQLLTEDKHELLYELLLAAATIHDLNVGVDEYPDINTAIRYFQSCLSFVIVRHGALVGAVTLQPWLACRTVDTHVAKVSIFLVPHNEAQLRFRSFLRLSEDLLRCHGRGFTSCVHYVFITCARMICVLRDEGYVVTVSLPSSGSVTGYKKLVSSYIMYKKMAANTTRQVRMRNTSYGVTSDYSRIMIYILSFTR